MESWKELLINLAGLALLAVPAGLVCALLWFSMPAGRRQLLGPQRERMVSWRGIDVWFAFGVMLFVPSLILHAVESTGLITLLYGRVLAPKDPRREVWAIVLSLPVVVLLILGELRLLAGTRLYELGLTTWRMSRNVVAGYLGWLLLSPVVWSLFAILTQWMPSEEHSLLRVVNKSPEPVDWLLVCLSGIIAAPIVEEIVFRGVLQRWLNHNSPLGHILVACGAALIAYGSRSEQSAPELQWAPLLFVGAMLPGYGLVVGIAHYQGTRARLAKAAPAIYGSSLLFAAFHSGVWPSPIPLFVLAVGLGSLAYRTQSLIGPITMHALFNAVACLLLVLGG